MPATFDRIPAPDAGSRQAMYFGAGQDRAYRDGAYGYLDSMAMVARMATIAAYLHRLGARSVLDLGCGTAELLAHLDPSIRYVGIDIAPTAIAKAEQRFRGRHEATFHAVDLRDWIAPGTKFDAVVWAGIGQAWTLGGRGGQADDWLGVLAIAERLLTADGYLVFELVTPHWETLEQLIDARYRPVAGVDLDCFQSEESPRRSIRVMQKQDAEPIPLTLGHAGSSLIPGHIARRLIELAARMGQATDGPTLNLGYGYLYYGLVRLMQPEVVVSVGSYRGFSTVCLGLGVQDNGKGTCYFVDPGKVDDYWHDAANIRRLRESFGLSDRWIPVKETTQDALLDGSLPDRIDLLLIDGDHSYEGVRFDFERLGARVPPGGIILLHDAAVEGTGGFTPWEVKRFLENEVYGRTEYQTLTLPFDAGLALVRKTAVPDVATDGSG
jgi:predicted O-methyltransferase YrrM